MGHAPELLALPGMIPVERVKGRALAIYWSNDTHVRWNRIFDGIE